MRLTFYLTFCFLQIIFIAHAMEDRDNDFEPLLSIRLPYSVKKDEIINVPAVVYNYYHKDLDVNVTLDNSDGEYEIINFDNQVITEPKPTRIKRVQRRATATISFLIRPKVIGNVVLKFYASSLADFDIVYKKLKVVSEGIPQYETHALSVDLKKESQQKYQIEMDLPEGLIPDSVQAEVGVVGDIIDFIVNNLDNLVRMASGCGEQALSSLFPNYLLMKNLMNSNRRSESIKAKLHQNLNIGYRNFLNNRRRDGSFNNFGISGAKENPKNGSTWLTASFLRFLPQIREFLDVDEAIIEKGLAYLSKQQASNGAFVERSDYFPDSKRDPLTVTVAAVLAFLRHPAYADKYSQKINKGLNFIAKNLEKYTLLHAHLIAVYAANKDRHVVTRGMSLIKWLSVTHLANQTEWWHYEFLNDIEVTSYNLITSLRLNSTAVSNVVPMGRRLIARIDSLGRFAMSQDTVFGLIHLIMSDRRATYEPSKMDINVVSKDKNKIIKLTADNGILYKNVKFPKTKSLTIIANGTGSALMHYSFQYNLLQKVSKPSFTIKIYKRHDKDRSSRFEMSVCVKYVRRETSSNMALLEISTPSGFVINSESLKEIEKLKRVTYTELKNDDSLLVVYFDHLYRNDETCLTVEALRVHSVAMQKPASILLYDHYVTTRNAAAFYEVALNLCDICKTDEECRKCK